LRTTANGFELASSHSIASRKTPWSIVSVRRVVSTPTPSASIRCFSPLTTRGVMSRIGSWSIRPTT